MESTPPESNSSCDRQPNKAAPSWRSLRSKPLDLEKIQPTDTEIFSVLRGFCCVIEDIAEYSNVAEEDHKDLIYTATRIRWVTNCIQVRFGELCSELEEKKQR